MISIIKNLFYILQIMLLPTAMRKEYLMRCQYEVFGRF
jgi:hypothetical protein